MKKIKSTLLSCKDDYYPKELLKIKDYPKNLYCIGNKNLLNKKKIVAIVGSRKCTEYGRKYANFFANELSKKGVCIISGLAIGIDAAAHVGSLYEEGKTIAVLGGGINRMYPKENKWLLNEIIEKGGCVISEHKDDEEAKLDGFPKRNRIISGIADAVLVIEAEHRSGSKVTANYAKRQLKNIYCIPSNLGSKNGIGTNELIIKQEAKLAVSPIQIIEDLYKEKEDLGIQTEINQIPKEYEEIYNLVKENEMTNDEISRNLGINISEINSMLTIMELEGFINQIAGNTFAAVRR